jgi:hypothetical protein
MSLVKLSVSVGASAAVLLIAAGSALGVITVTIGNVDTYSNGTVGRLGSTSGINSDDPPQLNGTSGVLALQSFSAGGPVPPGALATLPGCQAQHEESARVHEYFDGDGTAYMIITQRGRVGNSITNMVEPDLSCGSNAGCVARATFTVNVATPYTLRGNINLDNQDVSGFVRLNNAIGIAIYSRFVANNGDFMTSGTLNPGTYTLHSNCNVAASSGQPDVVGNIDFAEAGSFDAYLTLGTAPQCDTIDFNRDGVAPDTQDLNDFLSVFGGGACSNDPFCGDIDFNNDGVAPDTEDVDAFLRLFGGGVC